jgi:DNA-binding transcriptional ArsR family regulator
MQNRLCRIKAAFFQALAHPTRIAIVELLRAKGEVPVSQICEQLGLEQANVSQLWVPKTSSAERIDANRAGERRLAERRRTRPGRECCLLQMEIGIRIRSSLSRPDAHYYRRDDSPCDGRERGYATRV